MAHGRDPHVGRLGFSGGPRWSRTTIPPPFSPPPTSPHHPSDGLLSPSSLFAAPRSLGPQGPRGGSRARAPAPSGRGPTPRAPLAPPVPVAGPALAPLPPAPSAASSSPRGAGPKPPPPRPPPGARLGGGRPPRAGPRRPTRRNSTAAAGVRGRRAGRGWGRVAGRGAGAGGAGGPWAGEGSQGPGNPFDSGPPLRGSRNFVPGVGEGLPALFFLVTSLSVAQWVAPSPPPPNAPRPWSDLSLYRKDSFTVTQL